MHNAEIIKKQLFEGKKRALLFYASFFTDVISTFEDEAEQTKVLWSILEYAFSSDSDKENIKLEDSNSYLKLVFQSIDIQTRRYQNRILIKNYKDEVSQYMLNHSSKSQSNKAFYDKAVEVQKHLNKLAYDVSNKDYTFEEVFEKIMLLLNIAEVNLDNPKHIACPSNYYYSEEMRKQHFVRR